MGTWSNKINGSDTFQDVYQTFFSLYNEGEDPINISKQIQDEFGEAFVDYDERNNSLFGLALAQWETKALDQTVYNQVKEIIESGNDLEVWKGLGADVKTIKQRQKILDKFLIQISTDREKAKRRVRKKFEFELISLVDSTAPDNLKNFRINEEYRDKKYIHTSGIMMWETGGGGSVLYFEEQGKKISVNWIDSQTLEVTYDRDIKFSMQKDSAYYYGDSIKVIYKAE